MKSAAINASLGWLAFDQPPRMLAAGMGGNIFSLLGMLLTVAVVLALAYWCTKLIGQRGIPGWARGSAGGDKLRLLWQLSLGKNERLVLVQLNQRCLLLGVTSGGISVLAELAEEEAALWLQKTGEKPVDVPKFADILRNSFPRKK